MNKSQIPRDQYVSNQIVIKTTKEGASYKHEIFIVSQSKQLIEVRTFLTRFPLPQLVNYEYEELL